jgi:hypothetical protein
MRAAAFCLILSLHLLAQGAFANSAPRETTGLSATMDTTPPNSSTPGVSCLTTKFAKTKDVTHYMIPLLEKYDHKICDQLEGTCIYNKDGEQYLHNYGYSDQPLAQERCQNGYGNNKNCLHPCRILAASMKYHHYGQIVFIKELVGMKCGNLERDGFEIVHDGYMVIADTGSPKYFHAAGRFDFFWGRCKDDQNGVCKEGSAVEISNAATNGSYCIVWDPNKPKVNAAIKDAFTLNVKAEAVLRGDLTAAAEFDLDNIP